IAVAQNVFHVGTNRGLEFEYTRDKLYYDIQNQEEPEGFRIDKPLFRGMKSADDVRKRLAEVVCEAAAKHGFDPKVEFVDHHLSHAAAAWYASEPGDPLIVTLDGEGDHLSGSVSVVRKNEIVRLAAIDQKDSLGNIYSAITRQLGFKISRHEGKITGLAAYGSPDEGEPILSSCVRMEDGIPVYRRQMSDLGRSLLSQVLPGAKTAYAPKPRTIAALIAHLSAEDQAASVQAFLEKQACAFVAEWMRRTGKTDLVLNGGVFANVKLNQRIAALPGVTSVFVFPNMGDGGNAIGAAQVIAARRGQEPERGRTQDVYLGPSYDSGAIAEVLEGRTNLDVQHPSDLIEQVAADIHAGLIVGWYQGRMEYGPRALGNRSILARPTERKLNDVLNKRLSRTEFMPFAPSCLIEHAQDCFDIQLDQLTHAAEFMTITFDVRPEWVERIQAVSHVDATARPQLVRKETAPRYHALISAYYRLSGIPMVVNTSFNNHEEPIVCQPSEALAALDAGVIDLLVMGDTVVRKRA
ncbi:MAG: hypothetical protein KDK91_34225, partial [Gammaproteobacteria bacterium]|nr:hypothetical protein [Gammaproteobacteria bacterium]